MLQPAATSFAIPQGQHRASPQLQRLHRPASQRQSSAAQAAEALATAAALAAAVPRPAKARRLWQSKTLVALRAEGEDPLLAEAKAAAEAARAEVEEAKAAAAALDSKAEPAKAAGPAEDTLLEEAKAAAEAAKLQLEAAKLRAEAEEIKRATTLANCEARAERLLGSREAAGIGLAELMVRMEDTEGLKLTGEEALRLATACGKIEEPIFFSFADLSSSKFDDELRKMSAEAGAAEAAKRAQEQAQAAQQSQAAAAAAPAASTNNAEVNDDRSFGTSLAGTFAYLFPLASAIPFAIPLFQQVQGLEIAFLPATILSIFLNSVPFASTIFFIVFIICAQQASLPRLLRFSFEQAVLLNLAQAPFVLVLFIAESTGNQQAIFAIQTLTFLATFVACLYCSVVTSSGEYADGLPFISDTSKGIIDGPTGPYDPGPPGSKTGKNQK